jgi:hypothetical protein
VGIEWSCLLVFCLGKAGGQFLLPAVLGRAFVPPCNLHRGTKAGYNTADEHASETQSPIVGPCAGVGDRRIVLCLNTAR